VDAGRSTLTGQPQWRGTREYTDAKSLVKQKVRAPKDHRGSGFARLELMRAFAGWGTLALPMIFSVLAAGACSAPDPGVEGLTRGQPNGDGGITPTDSGSGNDGQANSDGGGGQDSGSGQDSGGGQDSGAPVNAFSGSGAYASNQPGTSAAQFHTNNGVGVTPGKGVDCLSCHKNGGSGAQFLFAGTLFQDQNGTMAAVNKEVRVRGNDGTGLIANSDANGNFWYKGTTAIVNPATAGARDANQTVLMSGSITIFSCNKGGCHDGTTQAYLHIP
jgi:hypothetical protein